MSADVQISPFTKRRVERRDFTHCSQSPAYTKAINNALEITSKRHIVNQDNLELFLTSLDSKNVTDVCFIGVDIERRLKGCGFTRCAFFDCLVPPRAHYVQSHFVGTSIARESSLSHCTVQPIENSMCRIGNGSALFNCRLSDCQIGRSSLIVSDANDMVENCYYESGVIVLGGQHKFNRYAPGVEFYAFFCKPIEKMVETLNVPTQMRERISGLIKEKSPTILYSSRLHSLGQLPVKSIGATNAHWAIGSFRGNKSEHTRDFNDYLIKQIYFNKPDFNLASPPPDVKHFILNSGGLLKTTAHNFVNHIYQKAGIDTRNDYVNPNLIDELVNFASHRYLCTYNDNDGALKRINSYTNFLKVEVTMENMESFCRAVDRQVSHYVGRNISDVSKLRAEGGVHAR